MANDFALTAVTQDDVDPQELLLECLEFVDLNAYAASRASNNDDVLTHSQMMKATDRDEFLKAQVKEIDGLTEKNVWKLVRRPALPADAHVINGVWTYALKRSADRSFLKYKARFCVDGSRQRYGIDFAQVGGTVLGYLAKHSRPIAEAPGKAEAPRIEWLEYDWSLNEQRISR